MWLCQLSQGRWWEEEGTCWSLGHSSISEVWVSEPSGKGQEVDSWGSLHSQPNSQPWQIPGQWESPSLKNKRFMLPGKWDLRLSSDLYKYTHTHTHTHRDIHTHTLTHKYTHTYMYIHIHTLIHLFTHIYTQHTYTYIHTCTQTPTNTHNCWVYLALLLCVSVYRTTWD